MATQTDVIICKESTQPGDKLTAPNGSIWVATASPEQAGDEWMVPARVIATEREFRDMLVQEGFGNSWDSQFILLQSLWAKYWSLKTQPLNSLDAPKRKRPVMAGEFGK